MSAEECTTIIITCNMKHVCILYIYIERERDNMHRERERERERNNISDRERV